MNQFKMAKKKAIESGHHIENIGDLKTAGVKEPEAVTEPVKEAEAEPEIEVPATPEEVSAPEPVNEVIPEETIIEEAAVMHNPNLQPEAPVEASQPIEQQPEISEVKAQPIRQQASEAVPIIETPVQAPIQQPVVQPQQYVQPAAQISEPQIPVQAPTYVAQQPVMQTAYTEPLYQTQPAVNSYVAEEPAELAEPVSVRRTTSSKKNIPNIFSPKGEAKSMRKSLVLKPTSVKIAENYCAKNGGSFNELIQTLLDNFIDEYGL